jgi:catechol 2,3-dioxygenase-like lactoylglutathione lyase family enzyme
MIQGIHHASITTRDLDRLIAFYRDLLGFEVVMENEWGPGESPSSDRIYGLRDSAVRMAILKTGNAMLEIFQFQNPVGQRGEDSRAVAVPGLTHIALTVSDIRAEYARLSAAGVRFHCPPEETPGLCWATYGRDPDGNIFELLEPEPDGALAPPGR